MRATILLAAIVAITGGLGGAWASPPEDTKGFVVTQQLFDKDGNVLRERGHMSYDKDLGFERHYLHAAKAHQKPGGSPDPGTDCESDSYKKASYKWAAPYSAKASDYATILATSGETWDTKTGADIFGSITAGNDGAAGVQDWKNNLEWVSLGASTTIAVTTTWYSIASGQAVESDGQYNTYHAWSTAGLWDAMDVQNIATHEIGHTFGLGHPTGPASKIGCLTMYAYGSEGETGKRTLGDGDTLGIESLYGA